MTVKELLAKFDDHQPSVSLNATNDKNEDFSYDIHWKHLPLFENLVVEDFKITIDLYNEDADLLIKVDYKALMKIYEPFEKEKEKIEKQQRIENLEYSKKMHEDRIIDSKAELIKIEKRLKEERNK